MVRWRRLTRWLLQLFKSLPPGQGPQGAMDHGALMEGRQAAGCRCQCARIDYSLYAVTDSGMNAASGRSMADAISGAVAGGATMVQIREKDVDGAEFLDAVQTAIALCRPHGVPVIVNDRVDVAIAAGADGVHVGQDDLPCAEVRRLVGPDAIVGVSCKTLEQAKAAVAAGASYLGCGACFATQTKDSAAIGIEGVRAVVDDCPIPVVAIGGIDANNAAQVMKEAGCAGIAVVSALFNQPDVQQATSSLKGTLDVQLRIQYRNSLHCLHVKRIF
eukprot:TRINITY_DN11076_c0_g1_i1.p1 TRINITY_DN11076_c0_g1~~TRINITY_DN11076_c0_g1_i1.p1  ORF type:complete len:274 (+),score=32.46 TRINITY_DN11076_c0_g1_i1:3-824(+)